MFRFCALFYCDYIDVIMISHCWFRQRLVSVGQQIVANTTHNRKLLWICSLRCQTISIHSNGHYTDVTMTMMASQITSLTVVYPAVYSDADQRKHQSSASLGPVNSPHRGPVTRKMVPFDDVIKYAAYMSLVWGRRSISFASPVLRNEKHANIFCVS